MRPDPVFGLARQAGAVEIGAAQVAVGPDHHAVARRRQLEPADIAREVADLHRRSADRHAEQLVADRPPAIRNHKEPSAPNTASWPFSAPLTAAALRRSREVEQVERVDCACSCPSRCRTW